MPPWKHLNEILQKINDIISSLLIPYNRNAKEFVIMFYRLLKAFDKYLFELLRKRYIQNLYYFTQIKVKMNDYWKNKKGRKARISPLTGLIQRLHRRNPQRIRSTTKISYRSKRLLIINIRKRLLIFLGKTMRK